MTRSISLERYFKFETGRKFLSTGGKFLFLRNGVMINGKWNRHPLCLYYLVLGQFVDFFYRNWPWSGGIHLKHLHVCQHSSQNQAIR